MLLLLSFITLYVTELLFLLLQHDEKPHNTSGWKANLLLCAEHKRIVGRQIPPSICLCQITQTWGFSPLFHVTGEKTKVFGGFFATAAVSSFFWSWSERFREPRRAHCSNGAVCNYPRAVVSLWKARVQVLELRLQETNERRAKGWTWVSEAACLGNVHGGTFSLRKSPVCSWFSGNQ